MPLIALHYLALLGVILSIYFLYVKHTISKSRDYKPLCDLSENVSCSKATTSKYSNIAGMPNAFYGITFYLLVLFLPIKIIIYLAIIASAFSISLIYISFKLKIACPVCIPTYVINFLILYLSYSSQPLF